jgi:hypothetical protein
MNIYFQAMQFGENVFDDDCVEMAEKSRTMSTSQSWGGEGRAWTNPDRRWGAEICPNLKKLKIPNKK